MYHFPNWLTVFSRTLTMSGLDDQISIHYGLGGKVASQPEFLKEGYNTCKVWGVRKDLVFRIKVDRGYDQRGFKLTVMPDLYVEKVC